MLANTFDHLGRTGGRGLLGSQDPARFSVEDASTAYLAFPGSRSVSLTTAFALNQAEDKHLQPRAHGRTWPASWPTFSSRSYHLPTGS